MARKPPKPRHFIRSWRKHRGLTLEQLADRVDTTHASLSRIERGLQPYNQYMLEALADALRCEPADLIMRDPLQEDSIWSIWSQVPPETRPVVVNMMRGVVGRKTGTGG
jgi:transcriptional regulator with XRE-family HTH domain